jgi:hypothetical protein
MSTSRVTYEEPCVTAAKPQTITKSTPASEMRLRSALKSCIVGLFGVGELGGEVRGGVVLASAFGNRKRLNRVQQIEVDAGLAGVFEGSFGLGHVVNARSFFVWPNLFSRDVRTLEARWVRDRPPCLRIGEEPERFAFLEPARRDGTLHPEARKSPALLGAGLGVLAKAFFA